MLTALEETVIVIKRGQDSLDRAIESSSDLRRDLAGPNVLKDDLIFREPALDPERFPNAPYGASRNRSGPERFRNAPYGAFWILYGSIANPKNAPYGAF